MKLNEENKWFFSFAFDSAHVKYGVWCRPDTNLLLQRPFTSLVYLNDNTYTLYIFRIFLHEWEAKDVFRYCYSNKGTIYSKGLCTDWSSIYKLIGQSLHPSSFNQIWKVYMKVSIRDSKVYVINFLVRFTSEISIIHIHIVYYWKKNCQPFPPKCYMQLSMYTCTRVLFTYKVNSTCFIIMAVWTFDETASTRDASLR